MQLQFFQGDIIKANLSPTKGHEQSGYRPALVISNNDFNRLTNLIEIVPITNHGVEFPLHVRLDANTETTGQILCEQVRSIDPKYRDASFIEKCPKLVLEDVLTIVTETY